jgi:hypothetical protein
VCSDICCTDVDCPPGYVCRPTTSGGVLRCVPKPT